MTGHFKPDDIRSSGSPRAKPGSEAGAAALRSYEHNLAKVGVMGESLRPIKQALPVPLFGPSARIVTQLLATGRRDRISCRGLRTRSRSRTGAGIPEILTLVQNAPVREQETANVPVREYHYCKGRNPDLSVPVQEHTREATDLQIRPRPCRCW
jgi:hypothetical protein